MKTENHTLQTLSDNLAYFESLVSVQSDPSQFNALANPIQERIAAILGWLNEDAKTASTKDVDFAFSLLHAYTALLQRYFMNHPWRPLRDN